MFSLDVMFWILAISAIGSAVAVVSMDDVFWAALFLVASFLAIAGLFVLLNAEFLAAAQVLIYVGAISILLIFAIMITRNPQQGSTSNGFQLVSKILISILLISMSVALVNTEWNELHDYYEIGPGVGSESTTQVHAGAVNVFADTTPVLAELLLKNYVLPFEVASILLLAAVIGALVMVQERSR